MIKKIFHNNLQIALIIRNHFTAEGIVFFTPQDYSQQLGYMNRPSGYVIDPHVHNSVSREVHFTKEVLYIKSGRVRIDFYSDEKTYLESVIVSEGDIVLLAFGGHGFEILEAAEIFEVKQGPYAGDQDKTRFTPVPTELINIKG